MKIDGGKITYYQPHQQTVELSLIKSVNIVGGLVSSKGVLDRHFHIRIYAYFTLLFLFGVAYLYFGSDFFISAMWDDNKYKDLTDNEIIGVAWIFTIVLGLVIFAPLLFFLIFWTGIKENDCGGKGVIVELENSNQIIFASRDHERVQLVVEAVNKALHSWGNEVFEITDGEKPLKIPTFLKALGALSLAAFVFFIYSSIF
jgi:hypothetical protein